MPPEITKTLSEAFQAALAMPEVKIAGAGGLHAVWLDAGRGGKADAQHEAFKALSQKVKLSAD